MQKQFWSIQDFIKFKYITDYPEGRTRYSIRDSYRHRQKTDNDMFEDFPTQLIDTDGFLKEGFIHDVDRVVVFDESKNQEEHRITAWMVIDGVSFTYRKNCVAAAGCFIDWDKVTCAFIIEEEGPID